MMATDCVARRGEEWKTVAQMECYTESAAFNAALSRLRPSVGRWALRLADHDADFAEDLVQQALVKLWDMDPSRFHPTDDEPFVRRVLVRRMRNVVRDERLRALQYSRMGEGADDD